MPPQILFGDVGDLNLDSLRSILKNAGITRLDTAAMYRNGASEQAIGAAHLSADFTIDTKIFFSLPGFGTLKPDAIEQSLTRSLRSLRMEKVSVLYTHGPDYATPLRDQVHGFDRQFKLDKFEFLGLSNVMPDMVQEWIDLAMAEGCVRPRVFQGQYNLLCRSYEHELLPILREHEMSFVAYSPLAGGFLLGNYTEEGVQGGKRFATANRYTHSYNKPSMHAAIKSLRAIGQETGLSMDELSLRWLMFHSALKDGDGMILGASKLEHVEKAATQLARGPLDAEVVAKLDGLWDGVREDAASIVDTSMKAFQKR